ncbi:hypothetical protein [Variovorax sp. dw_954]|uniref:hypothetical protein n=1 Tax=Variovorax sp. dw_954 TaxID=2720078 RepID=UPI001BD5E531|nr:hypothetical protein [Variovorax sp. dw_954]
MKNPDKLPRGLSDEVLRLGAGRYSNLCMKNGQVCGIGQMLLTHGILVGMSLHSSAQRRYCYEYKADAVRALNEWDGHGHPPGPWVKVKGRMGDVLLDELGPGATNPVG